jgi:hypothetical protein
LHVTGKEAIKQLRTLKRHEWDKLEALTREIADQSRAPLEAVGGIWASQTGDERRKAARVLRALEELGIRAWLNQFGRVSATDRLEAAEAVIESYRSVQQRVTEILRPLLDDRTNVPQAAPPEPVEEKRPPTRVCDEAYLLLRQLLKADERQMVALESERAFLHQTDPERDRTIKRYRDKQEWAELLEDRDSKGGR